MALLGRGVLAFHPRLVQLTGSVTSALMLSQSLYWTKVLALQGPSRDGWFWKTRQEWRNETSLSRHEQDGARARMSKHAFWNERRVGMPARLWYRIDLAALAREIDADFTGQWDWRDEQALMRLLGRPLLVYRALADLTGSVTSALLLSRLIMDERVTLRGAAAQDGGGWRGFDRQRMLSGTGLTRAEFYSARKTLRDAGFLSERCVGLPPRWEWRLELDAIAAALEASVATETARKPPDERPAQSSLELQQPASNAPETRAVTLLAEIRTSSMWQTRIQECGKPTYRESGIRPTEVPGFGQLDFLIPANMVDGIRTPGRPDSRLPIEGLTTGKPITSNLLPPTPSRTPKHARGGSMGGGGAEPVFSPPSPAAKPRKPTEPVAAVPFDGGEPTPEALLIWPSILLEGERRTAMRLLDHLENECRQRLLDELAGQAAQRPIPQPLAYLRRLVENHRAGTFIPLAADRIVEARRRQAINRRERERLGVAPVSPTPTRVELTEEQREARRRDLELMKQRLSRSSVTFSAHTTRQPEH